MTKKVLLGLAVVLAVISAAVAFWGGSSEPIRAAWIPPQVVGDVVSIPVSEVENYKIVHFWFRPQNSNMTFMAYELGGEVYVRANACPPCGSVGFSLDRDVLVCDMCATTFTGRTGDGIRGPCVDYPKASVLYEITGGKVVMKEAALIVAWENTLGRGWP